MWNVKRKKLSSRFSRREDDTVRRRGLLGRNVADRQVRTRERDKERTDPPWEATKLQDTTAQSTDLSQNDQATAEQVRNSVEQRQLSQMERKQQTKVQEASTLIDRVDKDVEL